MRTGKGKLVICDGVTKARGRRSLFCDGICTHGKPHDANCYCGIVCGFRDRPVLCVHVRDQAVEKEGGK